MKPIKLFLALTVTVLLGACANKPTNYTVTGNLNGFLDMYGEGSSIDSAYINISFNDSTLNEMTTLGDKVAVAPDGTFVLKGSIDAPKEAYLMADLTVSGGKGGSMLLFILEPGEIVINDFMKGDIQGTPLNDAVYNELTYLKQIADSTELKLQRIAAFFEKYKHTPAPVALLYYSAVVNLLTLEESAAVIESADPSILKSPFADSYISSIKKEMNKKALTVTTDEGCMFTDFEVEYNGKVQRLADYVGHGQYVLVDFWASWCGPCREEIPGLVEIYKQYKDRGLVVLGVAVNDTPANTEKAIKELGIPYPQIMNGGHTPAEIYGITGIPHIILFGPDGTILKRGMRGEAIGQVVRECLELE